MHGHPTADNLRTASDARRGPGGRTPRQFRHRLQDARLNLDALLDKGTIWRNKRIRRRPTLYSRIHEEWTEPEDTELELLVLAYGTGGSGERHEGR